MSYSQTLEVSSNKAEEFLVHWKRLADGTWVVVDCKPKSQLSHEQQRFYRKTQKEFYADQEMKLQDGKILGYPCAPYRDLPCDPICGAPHLLKDKKR